MVNVNGTVIWMVVGEEAQAVIAADSVATELTVALVVPVPPKGRLPPPPQVSVLPSREGVQVHPEPAINGELEW